MGPAHGRPFEDETAGRLIEAAFDLVAAGGWADFSLRAAAEAVGAAGLAASHRFGDRAGLVAAVAEAALEAEALEMSRFLPGVTASGAAELSAMLHAWLEQRARASRRQARVCAELIRVSHRDPALPGFGARWLDLAGRWIGRLYPEASQGAGRSIAAFLAAETPFRLLLADDPEFRLVSQESLSRAVGLALGGRDLPPPVWLQRSLALPPPEAPAGLSGAKAAIAAAAAVLIAGDGVLALTHREIARRLGAALSSLTYHFRSLDDLVRHGFQRLFDGESVPPAAAIYELALQALRDPGLALLALTVRRRLALDGPAPADFAVLGAREAERIEQIAFAQAGRPA